MGKDIFVLRIGQQKKANILKDVLGVYFASCFIVWGQSVVPLKKYIKTRSEIHLRKNIYWIRERVTDALMEIQISELLG